MLTSQKGRGWTCIDLTKLPPLRRASQDGAGRFTRSTNSGGVELGAEFGESELVVGEVKGIRIGEGDLE